MGIVESESVIVDPTGDKPSPIECGISIDPPMGWTVRNAYFIFMSVMSVAI